MKVRLESVRLSEPLDSVEPFNSTAYNVKEGWGIVWDQDLQTIEFARVIRGAEWVGECSFTKARHWVRAAEQKAAKKP